MRKRFSLTACGVIALAVYATAHDYPLRKDDSVAAATSRVRDAVYSLRSMPASTRQAKVLSISKDEDHVLWSGVSAEFVEVIALKALAYTYCGKTTEAEKLLGEYRDVLSEFNPRHELQGSSSTNSPYVISKYAEAILCEMVASNTTDKVVRTRYRVRALKAANDVYGMLPNSGIGREMHDCIRRMKDELSK
jgi:hypothetical protein